MNSSLLLLIAIFFFPSDALDQQPPTPHRQLIPPSTAPYSYWMKIKALFSQAPSYLFPPNLDFRGRSNDESGIEGGATDMVKEAVAKTLGKGKATLEESAKSAANLAKENLNLKDTLSSPAPAPAHHQPHEEL